MKRSNRSFLRATIGLLPGLASMLVQAAPASVIRASELRARPFLDAPVVARLEINALVDTQATDGAWTQVKTGEGKTGWLRMLNLRPQAGAQVGGDVVKTLAGLGNVARTGSTGTTTTTGAKGLSKEDLDKASPNEAEVRRLEAYRVSAAQVERHARDSKLVARQVEFPVAQQ